MKRIFNFFKEVKLELNKVVWPNWDEITRSTFVIFVAIIMITLMVFGIDYIVNLGISKILG